MAGSGDERLLSCCLYPWKIPGTLFDTYQVPGTLHYGGNIYTSGTILAVFLFFFSQPIYEVRLAFFSPSYSGNSDAGSHSRVFPIIVTPSALSPSSTRVELRCTVLHTFLIIPVSIVGIFYQDMYICGCSA